MFKKTTTLAVLLSAITLTACAGEHDKKTKNVVVELQKGCKATEQEVLHAYAKLGVHHIDMSEYKSNGEIILTHYAKNPVHDAKVKKATHSFGCKVEKLIKA